MLGFFGWKIATIYVLCGLAIGIFCGFLLGKMGLEVHLVEDMLPKTDTDFEGKDFHGFWPRLIFGLKEAVLIIKKLWLWILIGVGIGAFIHNYVPEEAIQSIISKAGIFSVPIATVLGVPMYGSCAAIIPIAVVLFQKGVPLGTALAFMMAISALSLPEAVMLRRAMKLPLIALFFGITALGIIFVGYLINAVQPFLV